MIGPGLFVGRLRHRRMGPRAHAFTYPLFMVLLDVDRVPALMRASRFTSYNRWNWASFHERDHLGDPSLPLRDRLAIDARRNGLELPDGPLFLLTHLRYLGYCFNPVSFVYCFDRDAQLRLVLAEVRNTFGGAHNYWLRPASSSGTFRATAEKSLYVSPFLPVDMDYTFAFTPPAERLVAHMRAFRGGSMLLDATLSLERQPWTARSIRRALVAHPAMTMSVIGAIHWEALKLWWKGVPPVGRATPDGVGEREAWHAGTDTESMKERRA